MKDISKILSKHISCYHLFLLITALAMFGLNLLDAPTLSDDMIYRFMWNENDTDAVKSINNLNDLFLSQYIHYMTVNGRFIAHFLAQFFLVFIPPIVLHIINTLLFVLLIHLCTCWTNCNNSQRLFVASVSCFLLFVVFQGFRTTIVWGLGTFNYLWTLVTVMTFLLCLMRSEKLNTALHGVLSLFALIAGWSHEALSLPVSAALIAYLIVNRKDILRMTTVLYMIWFMAGTLLCLLSPGVWGRSTESVTLMSRMLSGAINLVFNIRVFWLLVILLVILWYKESRGKKQKERMVSLKLHFMKHVYEYVALSVALIIVLLCGTNLERVAFFVDFISMMLLLSLLLSFVPVGWLRRLAVICCILLLLFYVPAYMVRQENYDNWKLAEEQMEEKGREVIAVHQPVKGENWMMDYFREHYVNSSFDFGFYCSYMGFDSEDINMRCAARLYNKNKLVFLPSDVVERIERDSTAYTSYEMDRNKSLYILRLQSERPVTKVRFMLKDEDISKLMPHQRLLVYHDNNFELDDFKFEVVHVCNRPYLVFTRPTTNIFRRISSIEIE